MTVMRSFCAVLSIRLGTIIVTAICALQAFVCLILSTIWIHVPNEETSLHLNNIVHGVDLLYASSLAQSISQNPSLFSKLSLLLSCIYLASCALATYGAYKCNASMLVGFILVEFIRLGLLTAVHITGMIIIRENSQDLGLIIGATLAGSFLLTLHFYCFAVVLSLWQVLKGLELSGSLGSILVQKRNEPLTLIDDYKQFRGRPIYKPVSYQLSSYGSLIAPVY